MKNQCTEEQFLSDVKNHVMTIVRDGELGRHIRYSKPGCIDGRFDLITWPGHLCISGDYGTYVFSRTTDMFEFFRTDKKHATQSNPEKQLCINPGYWGEKLLSVSRFEGYEQYSEEKFKEIIIEEFREKFGPGSNREARIECWESIKENVLCFSDNEFEAYQAASEFECNGFSFDDFFEHDLKEYTYHYIWCLHAIAWGIEKYDALLVKG